MHNVSAGVSSILNPGGNVKKLERELQFAHTFQNRVRLADAYLGTGQVQKAVSLYEKSLTGNFSENEHILQQLILAYYDQQRYAEVITAAGKIYKQPQFNRSRAHICYTLSLEKTDQLQKAEEEFKKLGGYFSQYEARYQYAKFLQRHNRSEEALKLLKEML